MMTEIGRQFAFVAAEVIRVHGNGSNKMVEGYAIIQGDGNCSGECYGIDNRAELNKLVEMGYLRKFEGRERVSNRRRNWRYRFMVKPMYFGLTAEGWKVASKYVERLNAGVA